MRSLNSHTLSHTFPNNYYSFLFLFLGRIHQAFSFLHFGNFGSGIFDKINNNLLRKHLRLSGILKKRFEKCDQKSAKYFHPKIKNLLFKHRKLVSVLEKVHFFDNHETKELSEAILTNYYKAESILRSKAFEDGYVNEASDELTEFASKVSLRSLQDY